MTDTMHRRVAIALTPYIHHGIATPEEAATAVLKAMQEPTKKMMDGGRDGAARVFENHGYFDKRGMADLCAIAGYKGSIDVAMRGD